jgi:adenylate kinase family enzyme
MDTRNLFQRTVIVGNSGSGKSFLAKQLAEILKFQVIHFDEYFWEPGGFNKKRPIEIVRQEISAFSKHDNWIMEGVFGDLAAIALENSTAFIFLDKSWEECESALLSRGFNNSGTEDSLNAEKNFNELIAWASLYWNRNNSCSQKRHLQIFSDFQGSKFTFKNRSDSQIFLSKFNLL